MLWRWLRFWDRLCGWWWRIAGERIHDAIHGTFYDWYPPDLAKMCADDSFDYAVKLQDGSILQAQGAEPINREWVKLCMHPGVYHENQKMHKEAPHDAPFLFDRGVTVRIDAIVWIADAPNGS